jgi:hypothetical protein
MGEESACSERELAACLSATQMSCATVTRRRNEEAGVRR